MKIPSRVLGVLGGMGPAATVDFLAKLQAATPARIDADHVRVVMDLNPRVPDRHSAPEAAEVELAAMARRLARLGAEVLAMPCNTAHAHRTAIEAASGLRLIDMIAETARVAAEAGHDPVGVLATPGGERLYVEALGRLGLKAVTPEGGDRAELMSLIQGVKAGRLNDAARQAMRGLIAELAGRGARCVIAGCTEVPLLAADGETAVPVIDATQVLARACVEACIGTTVSA